MVNPLSLSLAKGKKGRQSVLLLQRLHSTGSPGTTLAAAELGKCAVERQEELVEQRSREGMRKRSESAERARRLKKGRWEKFLSVALRRRSELERLQKGEERRRLEEEEGSKREA